MIRLFHSAAENLHRLPRGVKTSYMVVDWFSMENGVGVVEKCLALILKAAQIPLSFDSNITCSALMFFKETELFLGATKICEAQLLDTLCTKRTITALTTLYITLFKYLWELTKIDVSENDPLLVQSLLDCLALKNTTIPACVQPHMVWEYLLNIANICQCISYGASVSR